jgi:hypothetical protein
MVFGEALNEAQSPEILRFYEAVARYCSLPLERNANQNNFSNQGMMDRAGTSSIGLPEYFARA